MTLVFFNCLELFILVKLSYELTFSSEFGLKSIIFFFIIFSKLMLSQTVL